MTPRLNFDDFIEIMLENAHEDFRKTELHNILARKHNQKVDEYESTLQHLTRI